MHVWFCCVWFSFSALAVRQSCLQSAIHCLLYFTLLNQEIGWKERTSPKWSIFVSGAGWDRRRTLTQSIDKTVLRNCHVWTVPRQCTVVTMQVAECLLGWKERRETGTWRRSSRRRAAFTRCIFERHSGQRLIHALHGRTPVACYPPPIWRHHAGLCVRPSVCPSRLFTGPLHIV